MKSRLPLRLLFRALSRAPDLSYTLLRGIIRKHLTSNVDYILSTGKATRPPIQISLRITNTCNHRCAVCGQYGKNGYMKSKKAAHLLKNIPLEKYKELIDEVAHYKPLFYITGGEPFLYPKFIELMNYIKSKHCVASVVTNGVLLEKYAEEIVRNKWDMVMVSFDGPEQIHDKCRNFKGAYKTAVNGLLKLEKLKRKYHSAKPFVLTSTTLSRINAPHIYETMEIGKKINPDLMVIYLSWFTSEEIGKSHAKILKDGLGVDAFTWRSYTNKFTKNDAGLFQNAVKEIEKMKFPFEHLVIPKLKNNEIADYYLNPSKMFGYSKCAAPFFMVDVMPNGDVVTCRDFIDIKVGNINEKPLLDIWNNQGYTQFRKLLIKRGGLLPQCSRCCGLMGF